jgi:hypothetical protein
MCVTLGPRISRSWTKPYAPPLKLELRELRMAVASELMRMAIRLAPRGDSIHLSARHKNHCAEIASPRRLGSWCPLDLDRRFRARSPIVHKDPKEIEGLTLLDEQLIRAAAGYGRHVRASYTAEGKRSYKYGHESHGSGEQCN